MVLKRVLVTIALILIVPAAALASPSLAPYRQTSPSFAKAEAAGHQGRIGQAIDMLDRLKGLEGNAVPPPQALDYQIGRLLEKSGDLEGALHRYRALGKGVLSDTALYREGLVQLRLGDVKGARVAFAQVSRSSSNWVNARLALSNALVREGRPSLGRAALRELFASDLGGSNLHRAKLALTRALAAGGQVESAVACALSAYLAASTENGARTASSELVSLDHRPSRLIRKLREVIHSKGRTLRRLSQWARRNPKVLRSLDPGLAAFIRGSYSLRGKRDLKLAVDRLKTSLARAKEPSLQAYAAFRLAVALTRVGDDEEAGQLYRRILEEFPSSPVAARAAVASARSMMRLGDHEGAVLVLKRVSTEYPESGLGNGAMWQMALAAMMAGRMEAALRHLDKVASRLEHGTGVLFGLAEKVRYFRGVMLVGLGRNIEGSTELERVARSYPHTYYGVLAVTKLAQLSEDKASFVSRTTGPVLLDAPANTPGFTRRSASRAPRFDVTEQALSVGPAVRGPVILWKLGYRREAIRELKARAAQGHLDEDDLVLLAALVSDGRSPRGAMFSQRYVRGWPGSRNQDIFTTAYPRPFSTDVMEVSGLHRMDPAFIYGVMRTESRFNPRARSGAGAIGVMQLMPRTAREVAARLVGEPKLARKLRSPGPNIRLGTTFLAELRGHFRGHLPLVLAGYNAGPGAARSFLRRMRDLPTDIFVEAVPYAQTSAFIKRVIGYTAGYRALYDEEGRGPFLLSPTLPEIPGPFMGKRNY